MRRKNFLRRKAVKFIERCGITKWLKSCVLLNIFKVLNWKTMSECQTRASPSILNYTKIDRNSKIHWQWKIPSNSLQNNVDWRWGAIFECGRRRKMYWNWWFLFLDLKIALNVGWNFSIFFFLIVWFFSHSIASIESVQTKLYLLASHWTDILLIHKRWICKSTTRLTREDENWKFIHGHLHII